MKKIKLTRQDADALKASLDSLKSINDSLDNSPLREITETLGGKFTKETPLNLRFAAMKKVAQVMRDSKLTPKDFKSMVKGLGL